MTKGEYATTDHTSKHRTADHHQRTSPENVRRHSTPVISQWIHVFLNLPTEYPAHQREQTRLDPLSPNRMFAQICFAREADDARTETPRTNASETPESSSIFPGFHRNRMNRFPLSRKISNQFAALSAPSKAESRAMNCISQHIPHTFSLDLRAPFPKIKTITKRPDASRR